MFCTRLSFVLLRFCCTWANRAPVISCLQDVFLNAKAVLSPELTAESPPSWSSFASVHVLLLALAFFVSRPQPWPKRSGLPSKTRFALWRPYMMRCGIVVWKTPRRRFMARPSSAVGVVICYAAGPLLTELLGRRSLGPALLYPSSHGCDRDIGEPRRPCQGPGKFSDPVLLHGVLTF